MEKNYISLENQIKSNHEEKIKEMKVFYFDKHNNYGFIDTNFNSNEQQLIEDKMKLLKCLSLDDKKNISIFRQLKNLFIGVEQIKKFLNSEEKEESETNLNEYSVNNQFQYNTNMNNEDYEQDKEILKIMLKFILIILKMKIMFKRSLHVIILKMKIMKIIK